jgi:hypothetical protein
MQLAMSFFIIIIQFLKAGTSKALVMDKAKSFKHSHEVREYWRLEKRKQRAQAKQRKA